MVLAQSSSIRAPAATAAPPSDQRRSSFLLRKFCKNPTLGKPPTFERNNSCISVKCADKIISQSNLRPKTLPTTNGHCCKLVSNEISSASKSVNRDQEDSLLPDHQDDDKKEEEVVDKKFSSSLPPSGFSGQRRNFSPQTQQELRPRALYRYDY